MIIKVRALGPEPTTIEDVIPAEKWDLDSKEIKVIGFIKVSVDAALYGTEVVCDATVRTLRKVTCSRCLDEVEQEDVCSFTLSYCTKEHPDTIDIEDDIREEVILNWPMIPLCSEDCKGLDPVTGEKIA
jgi:uncharacterized protein